MRSILVCVGTAGDAERVTRYVARIGATRSVRLVAPGQCALTRLAERAADVVIVDAAIARPDCVDFTRRLLARSPGAAVVLVGVGNPRDAAAAVAAGVQAVIQGYGYGDDLGAALTHGLLLTCSGGGRAPYSPPYRAAGPSRPHGLTNREVQVLRWMSQGYNNAQIGRELFISEDTVKTHARRLYRKLGVRDRAHAVAHALRVGVVS